MTELIYRAVRAFRRPATRAWLYRVLGAAALVAAGYGLLTEQRVALWLGLGAAILGTGTAAANTPTTRARARARDRQEVRRRLGWRN